MHRSTMEVAARRGGIALSMLTIAATAQAQHTTTTRRTQPSHNNQVSVIDARWTGFMIGVQTIAAPGVSITAPDLDGAFKTGFGPGGGVMAAYGFNRTFTAFASADVAKQGSAMDLVQGSFGLSHLEVGVKANLPYGNAATVPYLSGSIGRRGLGARVTDINTGQEGDLKFSGGMIALGGGVQHALSPTLALDGGLELGFGKFGHVDAGGQGANADVNGSTTIRLRFGMLWRPSGRRPS